MLSRSKMLNKLWELSPYSGDGSGGSRLGREEDGSEARIGGSVVTRDWPDCTEDLSRRYVVRELTKIDKLSE